MRHFVAVSILAIAAVAPAHAQSPVRIVAGVSGGATYYCLVTRCNSGQTIGVLAEVQPTRLIGFELGARRHFCFDCQRFLMGDAALVLRYPARALQPFVAAGLSRTSDPGALGTQAGVLGAAGAWAWLEPGWGAKLELRGRRFGPSDGLGELSLALAHRFGR